MLVEKTESSLGATLSSIQAVKKIVRIMNTQKAVTTVAQNQVEEVIKIRCCSNQIKKL